MTGTQRTRKSRVYLDLDYCMYDTDRMFEPIEKDLTRLVGSREPVLKTLEVLNEQGYSFEKHLRALGQPPDISEIKVKEYRLRLDSGNEFLFPGVVDGVAELATTHECHLLTFGYQPYQQRKYRGITALHGHIETRTHFVWQTTSKGDVLREAGDEVETFFLDDSPAHLLDAHAKAPWVQLVRMTLPHIIKPHAGDGSLWPTVTSFAEFVALIRKVASNP